MRTSRPPSFTLLLPSYVLRRSIALRALCSLWVLSLLGLTSISPTIDQEGPTRQPEDHSDQPSPSPQPPPDTLPTPSIPRTLIVCGATIGGFVYGHVLSTDLWWKGEPSPFHVDWEHDWTYALGADKLGHAWFPYASSRLFAQAFEWSGYSSSTSQWIGSGIALAYQSYTEIRDGFSAAWGFSWGDMGANIVGAALPILQQEIPCLRKYTYKISYHPSARFRAGSNRSIIDDYESSYHWLSFDVARLLPEHWGAGWPRWLNIALGHSVKDLDDRGAGRHELWLSLDWNLERLPGDGWFWTMMKRTLNVYRFPAPAIRFVGGIAVFLIRI